MDQTTSQQYIDTLIGQIMTAEEPESITAEMVAQIFEYLNSGAKNLKTETATLQEQIMQLSATSATTTIAPVNIAVAEGKTTLQRTAAGLKVGQIAYLVVTGSDGNLPSNQSSVTAHSDVASLFGSTGFGASVGDAIMVTKLSIGPLTIPVYRHMPLNDAKASEGSFPGAMGMESPWDKAQINKIPWLEGQVNERMKYLTRGESNMNNALESGVYPWCTLGRPSGCTGAFTCFVERTTNADGAGFYSIRQTALGRQAENGRVWTRFVFYKPGENPQFYDWKETADAYALSNSIAYLSDTKAGLFHEHRTSDVTGLDAKLEALSAAHTHAITDIDGAKEMHDVLIEAVEGKADTAHTHTIANVTGLQTKLDELSASQAAKADVGHTHAITDVEGASSWHDALATELEHKADVGHTHTVSNVAGLQGRLDSKLDTSAVGFSGSSGAARFITFPTTAFLNQQGYTNGITGADTWGYLKGVVRWIKDTQKPDSYATYIGTAQPGSIGTLIVNVLAISNDNGADPTLPLHASGIYISYGSMYPFYVTGGTFAPSNVFNGISTTARQLVTARTLWGQTFNGSDNVSGAMTGVTDLTASGTVHGGSVYSDGDIYATTDILCEGEVRSGGTVVAKNGRLELGCGVFVWYDEATGTLKCNKPISMTPEEPPA